MTKSQPQITPVGKLCTTARAIFQMQQHLVIGFDQQFIADVRIHHSF
jgi:hypothetical protein